MVWGQKLLKFTHHFRITVFNCKSVLMRILSSYHDAGIRNSQYSSKSAQCLAPWLIFNDPVVCYPRGIRKSNWKSHHRKSHHSGLDFSVLFQVLSTGYQIQRNSKSSLTLTSKIYSQHFLLTLQFDKNHPSSVWAKSKQEVLSQPLQC